MKRIVILLIAMVATLVFACNKESSTNNTASTDTSSTYNNSSTPATDTSATTGTGTEAVTSTAPLSKSDQDFAMKAVSGGQMEVDLGQLAASKATSNDVKDFANRMVTDHGKAGDDLKSLLSQKGATPPSMASAMETKTSNALSKKSGAAFDKAYMSDMVKDHEQDAKEFEKATKSIQDPDLKNWATQTLTIVQDHLKMAKDINSKLKK